MVTDAVLERFKDLYALLGSFFNVSSSLCSILPEEKPVGFRLKPPTLIHGQAPSSGWCLLFFCLFHLKLSHTGFTEMENRLNQTYNL